MNWDNESVIKLIDAYKRKEVLWYPKHKNYYNKLLRKNAWDELEVELQRPIEQIKKKMDYLLAALRREKQKNTKSKTTGQGSDNVYRSSWFAYPHMLFLLDRNKPRDRLNTEDFTEDDEKRQVLDTRSKGSAEEGMEKNQESRKPDPVPIKKAKISESQKNPRLSEEALKLMRTSGQPATAAIVRTTSFPAVAPDRFQIYANYLASKFRNYTASTFMTVEYQINNILFAADRGQFDWERRHQSNSNSSKAPTPVAAPNQNIDNDDDDNLLL